MEALKVYGTITGIGCLFRTICDTSPIVYAFVYGITSAITANILNNIPMTVAFVPLIQNATKEGLPAAILASTVGSNLGDNLTAIGSLAGIMWMRILRSKDFYLSNGEPKYL